MTGPKQSVTIQSLAQTPDSTGALVDAWTDMATLKGVLHEKSARKKYLNGKDTMYSDYTLWVGYVAGITEKHRVKFGTRLFLIQSIANQFEKNRLLVLDLLEVR